MDTIKFIVVDDTTLYRHILRQLVARHDRWSVVGEAEDGAAAIKLAQRLRPSIVLMDVNMPGLNGVEATTRLKATIPETRVVLFSGFRYRTLADAGDQAGADAFFWKEDLDDIVLEELVEQWFPSNS